MEIASLWEHMIKMVDGLKDYKSLLEDGAHPNTKGHEEMFVIVKEFLEKKKII